MLDLLTQHGVSNKFRYIIWLDDLFPSAYLLGIVKEEGFGAAGTIRTSKTQREVFEAQSGTERQ